MSERGQREAEAMSERARERQRPAGLTCSEASLFPERSTISSSEKPSSVRPTVVIWFPARLRSPSLCRVSRPWGCVRGEGRGRGGGGGGVGEGANRQPLSRLL